jgi:hypothetical protein
VTADDLGSEANRLKGQVEQADRATQDADDQADQDDAALKSAQANQKAAATCAKGAVSALGQLINGSESQQASQQAADTLNAVQSACDAVNSGG